MNMLRKEPGIARAAASQVQTSEEDAGQRIDNFLIRILKGVPKSHIYRLLRTGQVRVNSRRVDATYRLQTDDRIRVPPLEAKAPVTVQRTRAGSGPSGLMSTVLFEDECLLVIDKPAGVAAHGGSGVSSGVIERLRSERLELRFLELVHRLDRDTSGVLLLAKKRSALTNLHAQIRAGTVRKHYTVLAKGRWPRQEQHVRLGLNRHVTAEGERRVSVVRDGMASHSIFRRLRTVGDFTLINAQIMTGRTHQIRVHLAHLGYPVVGDDKYGDFALNKALQKQGLRRMFLHARSIEFIHPKTGAPSTLDVPLAPELQRFLDRLAIADPAYG